MQTSVAIQMLEIVASGLQALRRQVVFVGGATVALYADEPSAAVPRPTEDVDCTVEITSLTEYYKLEKEVKHLGFKNQMGNGPLCRWKYNGVTVDIIPSQTNVLGFRSTWYPGGIKTAQVVTLPSKTRISIFSLPYFLASKLEAFSDRGNGDLRGSSDFEDIVTVLDGCTAAKDKVLAAPPDVKIFIAAQYKKISSVEDFYEGVIANLNERERPERARRIIDIFKSVGT